MHPARIMPIQTVRFPPQPGRRRAQFEADRRLLETADANDGVPELPGLKLPRRSLYRAGAISRFGGIAVVHNHHDPLGVESAMVLKPGLDPAPSAPLHNANR